MDAQQEDFVRWLEEGCVHLGRMEVTIEHLTQQNEELLRRLEELQAVLSRGAQDANRLRTERDELLAVVNRLAFLVDQVRLSRGRRPTI
jgi:hypothetical protein